MSFDVNQIIMESLLELNENAQLYRMGEDAGRHARKTFIKGVEKTAKETPAKLEQIRKEAEESIKTVPTATRREIDSFKKGVEQIVSPPSDKKVNTLSGQQINEKSEKSIISPKNVGETQKETSPVVVNPKSKVTSPDEDFLAKKAKELASPLPTSSPPKTTYSEKDLADARAEAEAKGFERGKIHVKEGMRLDQEDISATRAMQKAADEEAAASAAKNARLDQEDVSASQAMQKAADEEARLAAERAARKAAGLDVGVDTHLRRAINRVGQALGIKRSAWDEEAAEAGVQTHLARAGRRTLQAFRENDPYAIGTGAGAAGIAAGLGALAMAKKLRGSKKGRARA